MRTLLFSLLLAAMPNFIFAQIDDLLKDKSISYLATFEAEHDFRLSSKHEKSKLQLLKFTSPDDQCHDFSTDNWFAKWLLNGVYEYRYPAYKDADLQEKYDLKELDDRISSVDTVITFNPKNYEEKVQVIRNDLSADDIVGFRTSEAIFYDKKSGSYGTRLLAIAPMVKETDPTGKPLRVVPLAWLKMDGKAAEGLTPKSPDVVMAMLMIDNGNALEISKLNVKKNETQKTFAELLFQESMSMRHEVESTQSYGCGEKLSKAALEHMTSSVDTVLIFDPETYGETIYIVKNEMKPSDIKQATLVQEWYYDNRQKRVANRLKAIAPRVDVIDENGTFLYTRNVFFLHVSSRI